MPDALTTVQKFFPNVEVVVDAERPAAIEVSARDVSTSARKAHATCAMAVACRRKFHLDGVIISRTMAYLVKGTHARRFQLPPSVQREVTAFDRSGAFAPGRYQLSAIGESKKQGRSKPKGPKTTVGKPPRFRHITSGIRAVLGGKADEA